MDTHIPRFETIDGQTWHRCTRCSFVAIMSWDPDYAAVVVAPGAPGVSHIAHGLTFSPDSDAPPMIAPPVMDRSTRAYRS